MPSEHDKDETFEAIFDFKMLQGTEYHNIDNEFTINTSLNFSLKPYYIFWDL